MTLPMTLEARLLPANVEVSLFFVFDGAGRLAKKTFTRQRAMGKIKKGLARRLGPNTLQHRAVFDDGAVTFDPDAVFPDDLIILEQPPDGRYAEETACLIELHNIEAVKLYPEYGLPGPEENGAHNCRFYSRFAPRLTGRSGRAARYRIEKPTLRRLCRRVLKKKRRAGLNPSASGENFLSRVMRERKEAEEELAGTAGTFVCPDTGYLPGAGERCGGCAVRKTCERLMLYPGPHPEKRVQEGLPERAVNILRKRVLEEFRAFAVRMPDHCLLASEPSRFVCPETCGARGCEARAMASGFGQVKYNLLRFLGPDGPKVYEAVAGKMTRGRGLKGTLEYLNRTLQNAPYPQAEHFQRMDQALAKSIASGTVCPRTGCFPAPGLVPREICENACPGARGDCEQNHYYLIGLLGRIPRRLSAQVLRNLIRQAAGMLETHDPNEHPVDYITIARYYISRFYKNPEEKLAEVLRPFFLKAGRSEVCRFDGIIIRMYPAAGSPSHFHVEYGDHEAVVSIAEPALRKGFLPRKVAKKVLNWARKHRDELESNWEFVKDYKQPGPIDSP